MGANRALGYDAAVTVRNFVLTPSPFDAFRRQVVFNNHPLFSFLEHLVVDVTGSSAEATLRVLPALFGAASVGLIGWLIARCYGVIAGVIGALVLALNPIFFSAARDVRGYTLLVLCAVVATLLLGTHGRGGTAYAIVVAAGCATHLYMLLVVMCHGAVLWRRTPLQPWRVRWLGASLCAIIANWPLLVGRSIGDRARRFRPDFPLDLVRELLGGTLWTTMLLGVVVVVGWCHAGSRSWRRALCAVCVIAMIVWIVAPYDLYPRFFVWLVPGVALLAGAGVARAPRTVLALAVGALVAAVTSLPPLREDVLANRRIAELVAPAIARGENVCALGWSAEAFGPYLHVEAHDDVKGCDLAVVLVPGAHPELVKTAESRFRRRVVVPAQSPGLLFEEPVEGVEARPG